MARQKVFLFPDGIVFSSPGLRKCKFTRSLTQLHPGGKSPSPGNVCGAARQTAFQQSVMHPRPASCSDNSVISITRHRFICFFKYGCKHLMFLSRRNASFAAYLKDRSAPIENNQQNSGICPTCLIPELAVFQVQVKTQQSSLVPRSCIVYHSAHLQPDQFNLF